MPKGKGVRTALREGKAKGGFIGKAAKYAGYAYSAYKLARIVYNLVNVEKKYFDNQNVQSADTSGAVYNLSLVTTGTGANQRVGQSIKATSQLIKGFIDFNDSSTNDQTVRIIIFQDPTNYANASAPAVTDVLEAAGDAYVVMQPYTRQFPARYKIWHDKCYNMAVGQARRLTLNKLIKFRQDLNKRMQSHMMWDETGDAQNDCRGGQVYMLICSDQGAASNPPSIRWYSRLRFVDN